MTRDAPDRTLPTTLVPILRTPRKAYLAFKDLIGRLKHATFRIEFSTGFATGTYRAIEPDFFNRDFMNLRSAALLPCTANVPLIDLN